jgi:outer membrane lipoprotein-sorting protein
MQSYKPFFSRFIALLIAPLIALLSLPLWLVSATPVFAEDANSALLKDVMNRLSQVKSANADFTEKKFVKLLTAPVESSGTLIYQSPNRFEKHTKKPLEEKMTVERDTVTLEQVARKKKQELFVGSYPALAAIIDGMRGALSGNLAALQQTFNIKVEGNAARWTLNLVPLDAQQFAYINAIRVSGKEDFIDAIEILQSDGDRSVMSMTRATTRGTSERR